LAAEIQEAIVDVLVAKTLRAVKKFSPNYLLLAGGVAANARLRKKFEEQIKNQKLEVVFRVPPPRLCTDNAAYIAGCAYFLHSEVTWKNLAVNPELTIVGQI
jgi:N6-L-threonylcarbamoyladenine synthase